MKKEVEQSEFYRVPRDNFDKTQINCPDCNGIGTIGFRDSIFTCPLCQGVKYLDFIDFRNIRSDEDLRQTFRMSGMYREKQKINNMIERAKNSVKKFNLEEDHY